jgi:hypothetical protein
MADGFSRDSALYIGRLSIELLSVRHALPAFQFEAYWNGYGKLSITVPLHPKLL